MNRLFATVWLACVGLALTAPSPRAAPSHEAARIVASGRAYGTIQAAAFNPDGTLLALTGTNRRLYLLSTQDGSEKHAMLVPGGVANALAFAPNNSHLAAGGFNRIYIWDSASGEPVKAIDTDAGRIIALSYAPDGKRMAAAGSDRTVRIFDTTSSSEIMRIATGSVAAETIAFSPDGKRVAGSSGRQAILWSAETGNVEHRFARSASQLSGVAFTPNGQALITGATNGEISVWELDQSEPQTTAKHHKGRILALATSDKNRLMASASQGRVVYLHNAETLEPLHRIDNLDTDVACIALSPDGLHLAVGLRAPRQSFALWRLNPKILHDGGGIVPIDGINADYLTRLEQEVLAEQNLARSNPAAYAEFARAFRRGFQGNIHVSGRTRRQTREGVAAVDEAIAFLSKARPVRPLAPSKGLSLAAADHVKDTGPKGTVGHTGSDNSQPADRIGRHGRWEKTCAENIAYGFSTAREIVLQLIIDDGVPDRGHRINIFNPAFRVSGVNMGTHKQYRVMCVIMYAGGFKD